MATAFNQDFPRDATVFMLPFLQHQNSLFTWERQNNQCKETPSSCTTSSYEAEEAHSILNIEILQQCFTRRIISEEEAAAEDIVPASSCKLLAYQALPEMPSMTLYHQLKKEKMSLETALQNGLCMSQFFFAFFSNTFNRFIQARIRVFRVCYKFSCK